jgi:hypothetical protein
MKSTQFGVSVSNSHLSPINGLNRRSTDWITRISVALSDFGQNISGIYGLIYLSGRPLQALALFVRGNSSHIEIICIMLFVLRMAPEAASVCSLLAHLWGEILHEFFYRL